MSENDFELGDLKTMQQGTRASTKNMVDIVFVIDKSGSMTPLIEGLKNNLINFADNLIANDKPIDFRLGFVAFDDHQYLIKDFTSDVGSFKNALTQITTSSSETGLPAIEEASDFSFLNDRHRFILFFTDEPVAGGGFPEKQMNGLDNLITKLGDKKINFYHLGVDYPEYAKFRSLSKIVYQPQNNFQQIDYSIFFETIAKSISSTSLNVSEQLKNTAKVYNLSDFGITKRNV